MSAFWAYFWPPFSAGLVIGAIAGAFAFHGPARRNLSLAIGALAAIASAALWHGPLGGANRLADEIERTMRQALIYNEIPEVSAHLHRGPLTRRMMLSGPADDFQRGQLIILANELPGVASATWSNDGGVPLIAEGAGVALLGFLFGLLLAYLRELRRRYNAHWNW